MIVVINKIDLAPRALTVAWKHYLLTKFPELKIVLFSSNPSEAAYAKGGELQQQRRGTQANVLYLYYQVIFLVFCMMIEPKGMYTILLLQIHVTLVSLTFAGHKILKSFSLFFSNKSYNYIFDILSKNSLLYIDRKYILCT